MSDPFSLPGGPVGREPYRANGRYKLFHPESGKPVTWSGATTVAKALADTYHLELWKQRMVAKGIAVREDLYALACATALEDKDKLNEIAAAALDAAGGSTGANAGTALHGFTEAVDRGETPVVPEKYRAGVAAYQAAMSGAGIKPVPGMIECKVAIPELEICGQFDRLLLGPGWTLPRIGDVKSQKAIISEVEIAVQLAIYSRATHIWSREADEWVPMPAVDPEVALVMHMPAGGSTCELIDFDIATGWELAKLCVTVRRQRSRRDLARPYRCPNPATNWSEQIAAATTVDELRRIWDQAQTAGGWTMAHTRQGLERKKELLQSA